MTTDLQGGNLINHVLMLRNVLHTMQLNAEGGFDLSLPSSRGIVNRNVAKGRVLLLVKLF